MSNLRIIFHLRIVYCLESRIFGASDRNELTVSIRFAREALQYLICLIQCIASTDMRNTRELYWMDLSRITHMIKQHLLLLCVNGSLYHHLLISTGPERSDFTSSGEILADINIPGGIVSPRGGEHLSLRVPTGKHLGFHWIVQSDLIVGYPLGHLDPLVSYADSRTVLSAVESGQTIPTEIHGCGDPA